MADEMLNLEWSFDDNGYMGSSSCEEEASDPSPRPDSWALRAQLQDLIYDLCQDVSLYLLVADHNFLCTKVC
jgi:hypothetical protein